MAKRVGHGLREFQQSLRNRKEKEDRIGELPRLHTRRAAPSSISSSIFLTSLLSYCHLRRVSLLLVAHARSLSPNVGVNRHSSSGRGRPTRLNKAGFPPSTLRPARSGRRDSIPRSLGNVKSNEDLEAAKFTEESDLSLPNRRKWQPLFIIKRSCWHLVSC